MSNEPAPEPTPTPTPSPTPTLDPAPAPTPTGEAPKPNEPPKADAPVALSAADIKLPEGLVADDKFMGDFIGLMNDQNLSPKDRAQKLVDLQAQALKAASEKGSQAWDELQTKWTSEIKADPEFGGPNLEANLGSISALIDKFGGGTPEQAHKLREVFDVTGFGNNPEGIRFLTRIAKELGIQRGPAAGSPGLPGMSQADILFPNQGKT